MTALGDELPVVYPATAMGTAARFAAEHGHHFKWCQSCRDQWLVLSPDGVWRFENMEDSQAAMAQVIEQQRSDHPEAMINVTIQRISQALSLAKIMLAVTLKEFDFDPWLFNCPGGVVDLQTQTLRPRTASDRFMMLAGATPSVDGSGSGRVVWSPGDTPHFLRHLEFMTQNLEKERQSEFVDCLQRFCGMMLIGSQDLKPQKSLNLTGRGRNGKGVFAEAVGHAMGDYAGKAPRRLFTARESDHSTEEAGCRDKRFLYVEEVKRVNSAIYKDMTGGGTHNARKMRKDDESFLKTWTFFFNTNFPLNLQGDVSEAIRGRLVVMDLGEASPVESRKDGIPGLLALEGAGILAWMVEGLRGWMADGGGETGLLIPEWAKEESRQQRDDDDVLADFLTDCFEVRPRDMTVSILGSDFCKAYNTRRKALGYSLIQPAEIYAELRNRVRLGLAVKPGGKNKTRIYGLKLGLEDFESVLITASEAQNEGLN